MERFTKVLKCKVLIMHKRCKVAGAWRLGSVLIKEAMSGEGARRVLYVRKT